MDRLFGLLAAIGLFTALSVHISTFIPGKLIAGAGAPLFWALHVGAIAAMVPFALATRKQFGPKQEAWDHLSVLPVWARALTTVAFAYVLVNFVLFFIMVESGELRAQNGQFSLWDDGRFVRSLSEQEYQLAKSRIARGFSGHWLIFYLVPLLYFWFRKTDAPVRSGESRRVSSTIGT